MGSSGPDWSEIHSKRPGGPLVPFLGFFSILYGLGVRLRLLSYKLGLLRRRSLPGFVVSVGNITAGGTGKTPAVLMLARWASKEGFRAAVLSRGYGGSFREDVLAVSDGERVLSNPDEAGDEPCVLAARLTGVPVVISRKRYLAGLYASERFGSDFFILDDGFQHLALKRDLDLILLDSSHPFGNGRLLPLGPLREPVGQVKRADACILTRAGDAGSGVHAPDFIGKDFPAMRIFRADHLPHSVVFPESGEVHDPKFLTGKRVIAFAGIARPDRFRETLERVGAEVVYFKGFRDHHPYGPDEITGLQGIRDQKGAEFLITTEKDWVRLASIHTAWDRMAYLCVEFSILDGQEEIFAMIRDSAGGE